jgi:ketosteroid isomerase-like protein
VAEGDKVVAAYVMTATSQGHPIRLRGVFRFVVRDDAIAHRVDYWDGVTYLRQTGVDI